MEMEGKRRMRHSVAHIQYLILKSVIKALVLMYCKFLSSGCGVFREHNYQTNKHDVQ